MSYRHAARIARHVAIVALTGMALVACSGDDEPDGPEGVFDPDEEQVDEKGTVQAFGTDDPGGTASSSRTAANYSGTLSGRADVEVSENNSTWWTLGSPQSFTVSLQNDGEVALSVAKDIPAGTYKYIRVNFDNVAGTVDSGGTVGTTPVGSDVDFQLGDTQNAVISLEVASHQLTAGSTVQVVVDFNSEQWMTEENLSNRQIPKSSFEHAARASFHAGG